MDRPGIVPARPVEGAVSNRRLSQFFVPIGVIAIIVMMVVPLPSVLLDFLIALNITGALLILLISMFVQRPLDFSIFPALLLVATLFRLALNISATRLVLLDGFAGKVIDAFGHFVVGGSLIVGMVIFLILVIVQLVVVTKGAERVAEVGARFTLDAMPGKQMAIDADLNAGLIDEPEARRRRTEVSSEADFYGAMDGASKFVKGDAIAAIIITLVNLIGGFGVGMAQKGMSFGDAISTYSLLSVGDGHARQGDGEVSGTAIECPMDRVELVLDVRRDLPVTGPVARGADGARLTMGLGGTVDDAVFDALSAMFTLLERELGVTRAEAVALAGVVVDVRVTQLVNEVVGAHAVLPANALRRS